MRFHPAALSGNNITTNDSNTLVNLPWGISAADCTQLHVGVVEFHLKTVAWHCACTMTTTWTRAVWRGGVCRLVTEDKGNRSLMCDSYSLDSRVFSSSLSVLRRWRFIVVICLTWTYLYSRLCIFIYANLLGNLVLRNATCAREGERVHSYSTIKPQGALLPQIRLKRYSTLISMSMRLFLKYIFCADGNVVTWVEFFLGFICSCQFLTTDHLFAALCCSASLSTLADLVKSKINSCPLLISASYSLKWCVV